MKRRKMRDLEEEVSCSLTRNNCLDDGVVRIKFLERRWVLMSAECIEKGNYRCHLTGTQSVHVG
jgi:hypothetical protein